MEKDLENNGKMRGKDIENLVDEHIPDVYGPPSWYRNDGNMLTENMCDMRIPKVYGPDPSFKPHAIGNDEDGIANSEGISACKLKTFFSRLFGEFSKKS